MNIRSITICDGPTEAVTMVNPGKMVITTDDEAIEFSVMDLIRIIKKEKCPRGKCMLFEASTEGEFYTKSCEFCKRFYADLFERKE
jgi:hypothetical protein